MEPSMYKEISYRVKGFRVVTCIIAAVTVVLCLLIGIGTWILVSGVHENDQFLNNIREHDITIIEGEIKEPLSLGQKSSTNDIDKVIQHIAEIDFKEGSPKGIEQPEIPQVALLQKASQPEVLAEQPVYVTYEENTDSVGRQKKNSQTILDRFIVFTNNLKDQVIANPNIFNNPNLQYIEKTFRSLGDYANEVLGYEYEEPATHRSKRSVLPMMIGNALKYFSYAAFTKFMYNEASAITEYKIESRKLHGDPEANFLDNIFWSKPTVPSQKPSRIDIVESNASEEVEESSKQPLVYGSDNWTPMVNQVSLDFMSELLNTLLKIMREFLLRDHVMECLWYMFCQDVNHQAKYSDIYGVMARVNR